MGFQSQVFFKQGFGVQGELNNNAAVIAQTYNLSSDDAANNVFGRAFSIARQGVAQAGNPEGGNFIYAGILTGPKQAASFGSSQGTLAPTLTLPNNAVGELTIAGVVTVELTDHAEIGHVVIYDNETGELSALPPGSLLPEGFSNAHATVYQYEAGNDEVSGACLATILLSPAAPVLLPAIVIAEGNFTWSGGGASVTQAVIFAEVGDTVMGSIMNAPTQAASWVSGEITAPSVLTVTISAANTSNDAVISYRVLRKQSA